MTVYQYPDYLAHFGVKGMKWGVRNKRYSAGVTKNGKAVSNKKSRKQITKQLSKIKEGKESPHYDKVYDKMRKEYEESDVVKDYAKSYKSGRGVTATQINACLKKGNEICAKYAQSSRGAVLKDLGYDDTEAGRNYVRTIFDENFS